MSVDEDRGHRMTRRYVLAGGLLAGLGASGAALSGRLGGRAASAQSKPMIAVHKSPT